MTDGRYRELEEQIIRGLDGALGDEEQLELNRILVRDPVARRLSEEHAAVDRVAGEAIRACAEAPLSFDPIALTEPGVAQRTARSHRAWWLMPSAVAAAILLAWVAPTMFRAPLSREVADPVAGPPSVHAPRGSGGAAPWSEDVRPVSDAAPRRTIRQNDRDLIGVVGSDGAIYWIEVDRLRTIRRNAPPRKDAPDEM
jgi:hypothetical protein